jgi:hypothetical protein
MQEFEDRKEERSVLGEFAHGMPDVETRKELYALLEGDPFFDVTLRKMAREAVEEVGGGVSDAFPDVAEVLSLADQALEHADAGRCEEALRLRDEAVKRAVDRFGEEHPATTTIVNRIARIEER